MERLGKVGQPMRLTANNYFSPPLGTTLIAISINNLLSTYAL
jgi:hypothetical protein